MLLICYRKEVVWTREGVRSERRWAEGVRALEEQRGLKFQGTERRTMDRIEEGFEVTEEFRRSPIT